MILEDLPRVIIIGVIYAISVLAAVDIAFRRWLGDPNDTTYQDKDTP